MASDESTKLQLSTQGDYGSAEKLELTHEGNSAALTAGIIIADVVGAGILSMAVAMAKFGWLLGTIVTLVMLAMNVHISIIIWRVRMKCPNVHTYMDLAKVTYATAPPAQQQFMVLLTGVSQQLLIGGMLGLYTLSLGKACGMLFYTTRLCLPIWTAIGCLVALPFVASARKLGAWQSLIWTNCASILITVIIPLCLMAREGVEKTRIEGSTYLPVEELSFGSVMSGLNLMLFSFSSQFMIVEIMDEMKNVADFRKSYMHFAAPFQAVTFLTCGLGGYYYHGDLVHGMIVDNIPFGPWFQLAAALLFVHMVLTWVFKGIVFCRALQHTFQPGDVEDRSTKGWLNWVLLVSATMAAAYLVAQVVPFFVDLVELLGAMLTPLVCFMLPITLYWHHCTDVDTEEDRPGYLECAVIFLEMLVAVVILFFGSYSAVTSIVDNWKTYGYPFACHCHYLWNTCECSAEHSGMEHCDVLM